MSDIPSILDNPDSFYEKVTEILMETNSHSMDLDNWFLNHLKPLLVLNNHNYFFIQILLKKLIKSGDANYNLYALQKVLEMIYKFSNEKSNDSTKFLSDAVRFAKTDQPLHTDLINSLTNIIRSGKLSGGDILKLYRLYKETSPPPDVSFLRAADIMEPLVIHTFAPGHPVSHMDEKIWLIAYAAFFNSSITCPDDIQKGKVTLDELNGFFGRVTSMAQMFDHLPSLLKLTKEPICATAVLLWIKTKLFDDDFYEWTSFSLGETPAAFHVLDEIAVLHPSHRPRVLDIWVSLFERDFDMVTPRLAPLVVVC
ncbi:TH1 protein [Globomyces pollinis-pini]|nr:TH1 protein [Globomyces pollinis-pini]